MTLPLTDDGENFGPTEAPPGQTVHPRFMGMMPSYLPGYVACKVKYCNDRRIMIYLQFCIDKSRRAGRQLGTDLASLDGGVFSEKLMRVDGHNCTEAGIVFTQNKT